MQTGSSGILIGWKSGQTTFVPQWDRMEGAWLRTLNNRAAKKNLKQLVTDLILWAFKKIYSSRDMVPLTDPNLAQPVAGRSAVAWAAGIRK